MRKDCCECHELLVSSITATATQLTINVSAVTLTDGWKYFIRLDTAFPTTLTGAEEVVIVVAGGPTVYLGDRRSRRVLSERVRQNGRLFMLFTQDSLAGAEGTPPVSSFVVVDGLRVYP